MEQKRIDPVAIANFFKEKGYSHKRGGFVSEDRKSLCITAAVLLMSNEMVGPDYLGIKFNQDPGTVNFGYMMRKVFELYGQNYSIGLMAANDGFDLEDALNHSWRAYKEKPDRKFATKEELAVGHGFTSEEAKLGLIDGQKVIELLK